MTRLTALTDGVLRIQDIQGQLDQRTTQAKGQGFADQVKEASKAMRTRFEGVRAELYEVYTRADQATLNYPVKLYQQYLSLNYQVQSADAAPPEQHGAIFQDLTARLTVQLDLLRKLEDTELVTFNQLMRQLGLPEVYVAKKTAM